MNDLGAVQVQLLLAAIAILLTLGLALGSVIGRQILNRLDKLSNTDEEQWKVIRTHERELGALDERSKARASAPVGGD